MTKLTDDQMNICVQTMKNYTWQKVMTVRQGKKILQSARALQILAGDESLR